MARISPPFFQRATTTLIGLIAFGYVIWIGQDIIIPLAFATILAILLNPVNQRLEKWGLPRLLSISLTILLAILLVGLLFYFLSTQVALFTEAIPKLKIKLLELQAQTQHWLNQNFGIGMDKQTDWISETTDSFTKKSGKMVSSTLSTLTGILVVVALLPVYVFLLLLYRPLLVEFLHRIFIKDDAKVSDILHETKSAIQNYMVGLIIEASIVATLNTTGLLIIGIDYAILLGVLGALLNLVPYIGGIIAVLLPVLIAIATKDSLTPVLAVIGLYAFVQFLDNNFLVPKIVASKVRINAIISILAVLIGGALCGVSGMFLSIPTVAILKIIFDRIEELRPWGLLLGDSIPGEQPKRSLWQSSSTAITKNTESAKNT
jgi:predicted PurR-regulated permease PerM